ncbi:MAG: indole-3-glycerol phosphate synthase TrpC [Alphaproteobacteria bacterium]|nr:indole-3-glycerol phosphate synthase TrpC [Alphaproteobacteria bacterium]MCD8570075.1 indole-3-glycerol phosphate synthase TrpC [Alphaproteobacteria bacterium]
MTPSNTLEKICADTANEVERRKAIVSLDDLKNRLEEASPPRGFLKNLKDKTAQGKPALIAEIKKASPSKGLIRADFDPPTLAKAYEAGGAACLSVLTDEPYFQGKDDYLKAARAAVPLPALRKDFMVDPYQIYESRVLGADCILIIMAALTDDMARKLYDTALHLGMDALIEVHDEPEMTRALTTLSPAMVGINSRNLKTLEVDLQTAHKLVTMIPHETFKIAESGIYSHDDLAALQQKGFQGFLVGESLMRQDDVTAATRALLGS